MAGKTAKSSPPDPKRRLIVFCSLAASLAATGALLKLLSPPPVAGQVQGTVLMGEPIERISLRNDESARKWKYIYVHQGRNLTTASSSQIGDHFVICNGQDGGDGDLLIGSRWKEQRPATPPSGASVIDPDCISIALSGDLDTSRPTQAQLRRLQELVSSLQITHRVPARNVWTVAHQSAAGVGRLFPMTQFRQQLRP